VIGPYRRDSCEALRARTRSSPHHGAQAGTAVIEIGGKGQDVWGTAPRKVIDKLLAAIE